MIFTNEDLKIQYNKLNKQYFGNKLPHDMVVRFGNIDMLGLTHTFYDRPLYIMINKRLKWSGVLVHMTLVHEMVHVENTPPNSHGKWFQNRMLQLAKKAFLGGTGE